MLDCEKTKEQLISELKAARQRITDLETSDVNRRKVEEALLLEQMFTQTLLSSLPGIFYLYTYPELRLVRWNTNHESLLGFKKGEIENRHIMEWHPPEQKELVLQAIEAVIEKGQNTIESPLLTKDGRSIPFLMTGTKLEVQGKTYLMGVGIDVSELRSQEKRLRIALKAWETTRESVHWIDEYGRMLYVNPAMERELGYSSDELLQMTIPDIDPNTPAELWGPDGELIRTMKASGLRKFESLHRHKDGHLIPVEIDSDGFDVGGQTVFIAIARDISERKRTEEALRASEAKFAAMFSLTPVPMLLTRFADGAMLEVSRSFAELFGYPRDKLVGKSVFSSDLALWVNPEDRYRWREKVEQTGETLGFEVLGRRKDGSVISVMLSGKIVEIGCEQCLIVVVVDVTERKQAEEALRASETRFRQLVESAPYAIFIQSGGRFAFPNQAAVKLFGAQRAEDLVGTSILERIHPDSREIVQERIRSVNQECQTQPVLEERYLRLDGTVLDVEVVGVPFYFEGKPGSVTFVHDITERKRMQEMMIQTEKMMSVGGLAAGMAHEINNPLGGILQSLQNIKRRISFDLPANVSAAREVGCSLEMIRDFLKSRQILEFLDSIEESGKRAARIVANMLEFSHKGTTGRVLVDVNTLIEKTIRLCATGYHPENKCNFKDILVERDLDPNDPKALCIPSQIEQVLVNLLLNAMQALENRQKTNPPPRITIRTKGEVETVVIEVEDNGPGMGSEVLRRVFDPFFTTKPVGKGTGLGLSVSYFIVTNNHGGSLKVESAPGRGARFIIRLPLNQIPSATISGA